MLFWGKSELSEPSSNELPVSLGCNVSEMLEKFLWNWEIASMDGNSTGGKSVGGNGPGTETEILCWISTPSSEYSCCLSNKPLKDLSHQRSLHLAVKLLLQHSFCLNLWKKTDSVY